MKPLDQVAAALVASASAKSAARLKVLRTSARAAGSNGADRDRGHDVRFPDAGRSDEQHASVRLDEASAGQFDDLGLRDPGIEAPVKVGQRLDDGDPGLFEPPGEEPICAPRELVLDEQFEKLEMRKRRGFGLDHAAG